MRILPGVLTRRWVSAKTHAGDMKIKSSKIRHPGITAFPFSYSQEGLSRRIIAPAADRY